MQRPSPMSSTARRRTRPSPRRCSPCLRSRHRPRDGRGGRSRRRLRRAQGAEAAPLGSARRPPRRPAREHGDARAPTAPTPSSAGRRALANVALDLWAASGDDARLAMVEQRFAAADNMTDRFAALAVLAQHAGPGARRPSPPSASANRTDALILDKWLAQQAAIPEEGTLARVEPCSPTPPSPWAIRTACGRSSAASPPAMPRSSTGPTAPLRLPRPRRHRHRSAQSAGGRAPPPGLPQLAGAGAGPQGAGEGGARARFGRPSPSRRTCATSSTGRSGNPANSPSALTKNFRFRDSATLDRSRPNRFL